MWYHTIRLSRAAGRRALGLVVTAISLQTPAISASLCRPRWTVLVSRRAARPLLFTRHPAACALLRLLPRVGRRQRRRGGQCVSIVLNVGSAVCITRALRSAPAVVQERFRAPLLRFMAIFTVRTRSSRAGRRALRARSPAVTSTETTHRHNNPAPQKTPPRSGGARVWWCLFRLMGAGRTGFRGGDGRPLLMRRGHARLAS